MEKHKERVWGDEWGTGAISSRIFSHVIYLFIYFGGVYKGKCAAVGERKVFGAFNLYGRYESGMKALND